MIQHIRYFSRFFVFFLLNALILKAENIKAVNDNIMLKEDESKIIDVCCKFI